MNQVATVIPAHFELTTPGDAADAAPFDPERVFVLIEQTADTLRFLRQENERISGRERACRAILERDRALWRTDVEKLRIAAEACLARAAQAENEAEVARTQAQFALIAYREIQGREQEALTRAEIAEGRADIAERWLARISDRLTTDVRQLLEQ